MSNPVIVLGLGPSGLFLVRQLHKLTQNIYGIGRADDIGLYSKYIAKSKRFIACSITELIEVFNQICRQEKSKPILYICSDQYLTLLLENDINLDFYVTLSGAKAETLRLINDKHEIVNYCKRHNIRIPSSYSYVDFYKMKDKDREFPVVIKWKNKKLNMHRNPIGKIRICQNTDEFSKIHSELQNSSVNTDELLIQTYIQGNNNCQYSIGGYYQNGQVLANIAVLQKKQYPQGVSAQVISITDIYAKELLKKTESFVKELNFTGFMEIEYKLDSATNQFYLLDINPRPWGWISILGTAYSDFHQVFLGKTPSCPFCPTVWTSTIRSLLAWRNKQNEAIHKSEYVSYAKAYDIFDKYDKMPSMMTLVIILTKVFRR